MDTVTQINSTVDHIDALPVINGYYLVLGGGKIGNKFIEHARSKRLPFVLVIDIDREAAASKNAKVFSDKEHLTGMLESLSDDRQSHETMGPVAETGPGASGVYFYCMAVKEVPSLLEYGIPEYIVPAIPSHAAVDILVDFLGSCQGSDVVKELSVTGDNSAMTFFEKLVSGLPEAVIAGKFPENGVIFLSYARPGEICPDNCRGPEGYCYNFKRVKPGTITACVRELSAKYPGWIFESCQMGPGIGGIRGRDLRENLVSLMNHIMFLKTGSSVNPSADSFIFVATTCNCHGILNILKIV